MCILWSTCEVSSFKPTLFLRVANFCHFITRVFSNVIQSNSSPKKSTWNMSKAELTLQGEEKDKLNKHRKGFLLHSLAQSGWRSGSDGLQAELSCTLVQQKAVPSSRGLLGLCFGYEWLVQAQLHSKQDAFHHAHSRRWFLPIGVCPVTGLFEGRRQSMSKQTSRQDSTRHFYTKGICT